MFRKYLILFIFISLQCSVVLSQELISDGGITRAERLKMVNYINGRYPEWAIKSQITLSSGDQIDCVLIDQQPSLRKLGIKAHEIPKYPAVEPDNKIKGEKNNQAVQEYGADGVICPDGTIPIGRYSLDTLLRFGNLNNFFKKHHTYDLKNFSVRQNRSFLNNGSTVQNNRTSQYIHEYAVYMNTLRNRGGGADISIHSPYVETTDEFSLSQIWITGGSGSDLETVEAGIQTYQMKYGDWRGRLFIYYTPDHYANGCYNLDCDAFVQTNNNYYIGGGFTTYSVIGGEQKEITLEWFRDVQGNWWLRAKGTDWVGYYPRSLFDSRGIGNNAEEINFGGEIIQRPNQSQHTKTDMGSGRWPSEGYRYSAYQTTMHYWDLSNIWQHANSGFEFATNRNCYNVSKRTSSNAGWYSYIFFGGAGHNSSCP